MAAFASARNAKGQFSSLHFTRCSRTLCHPLEFMTHEDLRQQEPLHVSTKIEHRDRGLVHQTNTQIFTGDDHSFRHALENDGDADFFLGQKAFLTSKRFRNDPQLTGMLPEEPWQSAQNHRPKIPICYSPENFQQFTRREDNGKNDPPEATPGEQKAGTPEEGFLHQLSDVGAMNRYPSPRTVSK
jgi:hypothetical protein